MGADLNALSISPSPYVNVLKENGHFRATSADESCLPATVVKVATRSRSIMHANCVGLSMAKPFRKRVHAIQLNKSLMARAVIQMSTSTATYLAGRVSFPEAFIG